MSKYEEMLASIPNKRFFTIGETSGLCQIKPHVLRYWEQEFPQLKPTKRRGGRRYYQHKDVVLICTISDLLYVKGFTIAGAKQQLCVNKESIPCPSDSPKKNQLNKPVSIIPQLIEELESLLTFLKSK